MEIWSSLDTELYTDIFNIQIRIFLISVPTALALPFVFCLSALALFSAPLCLSVPLWQSVKHGPLPCLHLV